MFKLYKLIIGMGTIILPVFFFPFFLFVIKFLFFFPTKKQPRGDCKVRNYQPRLVVFEQYRRVLTAMRIKKVDI